MGVSTNVLSKEFRLVLGDYSDDGHGKYENIDILLSKEMNSKDLANNFRSAVKYYGFDLLEVAEDYDSPSMQYKDYKALLADGFEPFEFEEVDNDKIDVDQDGYVRMLMHFFLFGISDVEWSISHKNVPALVGGWSNALGSYSVGYGLF